MTFAAKDALLRIVQRDANREKRSGPKRFCCTLIPNGIPNDRYLSDGAIASRDYRARPIRVLVDYSGSSALYVRGLADRNQVGPFRNHGDGSVG
ncbi:MAG: hypothetical protein Ct9H300mP16_14510 [Pseudomonadota bacterium]|nr:MAG: hypothetical protein Ct9H300mP16_14510 [Pseudomonadota bacterium]